jgi:ERCC4-type nuclease
MNELPARDVQMRNRGITAPWPCIEPSPTLLIDSREPWPHPWAQWLPAGWNIERATLETGDICLAHNAALAVERKTALDFLGCIGQNRERFDRELRRARHLDSFVIIVESDFPALIRMRGGLSPQSIVGTVAAWSRRYAPILFAGDAPHAAQLAWRFLAQPLEEARRIVAKASAA